MTATPSPTRHTARVVISTNPASPAEVVTEIPATTPEQAAAAVHAAHRAQDAWAQAPAGHRAQALHTAADTLAADTELALLICREEGKTLNAATSEAAKTVEQFRLAAQLAFMVEGATYPREAPTLATWTLRVPLGVIVAITPWNFPLSLAARKIAPALAAGNTVVLKPSPVTAGVGARLAQACHRAGIPHDVLHVVHGDAPDTMAALVGAPHVRALSFTGSNPVGDVLRRTAPPYTRLQFEMGGHNTAVVCADADLPRAAREIAAGAFTLTGQVCTATDRVLVERPALTALTHLLAEHVTALRTGRGTDPTVHLGPAATAAQKTRLDALVRSATAAGARVIAQGTPAPGLDPKGQWVLPTLLDGAPHDHPVNTHEIFGPLLSINPVDDVRQAVTVINADPHRLVTAVHTRDLATAGYVQRHARCGLVKINQRTTGNDLAPPFGGWGASSSGSFPEGGRTALDFVTDTKTVYCHYPEI